MPAIGNDCLLDDGLTSEVREQIVDDLTRTLERLDGLKLWLAGAYVASAIDSIQNEAVVDDVGP